MKVKLAFFIVTIFFSSRLIAGEVPKFTVALRQGVVVHVLVSPQTTKAQLKALIFDFRKARKSNSLSTMIPSTTPGLDDKYSILWLYIFSDPLWASEDMFKQFEHVDPRSSFNRAYVNQIKAFYYYDYTDKDKEEGSLGYYDGVVRSRCYKKIF